MDSFFLAEMFKYLFLIFAEKDDLIIDPERYVFTTEAHLLPLSLSKFTNHTDGIKPNHSKINVDGNPARSCLNPLPKGQTGKLYQNDELEQWRRFARSYMLQNSAGWSDKKRTTLKGKPEVKFSSPRLRAKDFMLGNKEHEKVLAKMGIQIVNRDSNVQLMHVAELAFNSQYSEEGLVFMKEMIQLNDEANSKGDSSESQNEVRHLAILASEGGVQELIAGPAQFGDDFSGGAVVGQLAKADPFTGCQRLVNCGAMRDKIALMKRGSCMFAEKVKNAEECGSIASIIVDNQPKSSNTALGLFSMAGDGETDVTMGSVFLSTQDADILFEAIRLDPDVKVAISNEKINVSELSREHENSDVYLPMENTTFDETPTAEKDEL